jgi:hypothetical protein
MQLSAITTPAAPTTPAPAAKVTDMYGWPIAEVKRGLFAGHAVSLVLDKRVSDFGSFTDAVAAAKQLSAGPAPATAVVENRYLEDGTKGVPADQRFSVYGVDFQEWKGERGGILINGGVNHQGDFSRTKGYELAADAYSNGEPHEVNVLVDGDLTWDNGIAPSA